MTGARFLCLTEKELERIKDGGENKVLRRFRKKGRTQLRFPSSEISSKVEKFKQEIASELGSDFDSNYWGNIGTRECGEMGGELIRSMLAEAEKELHQKKGGFNE